MNKKMLATVLGFALLAGRAEAANFAVITSPPTLINVVIFAISLGGVWGSVKVLSLVRGGQLSKSWQFFLAAFIVLVLCQVAMLLSALEIIVLPSFVIPACMAITTGLLLLGIIETKRVLS